MYKRVTIVNEIAVFGISYLCCLYVVGYFS